MYIYISIYDHTCDSQTCSHIAVTVTSLYFFVADHFLQAAARVLALKVPAERSQQISGAKGCKMMQKGYGQRSTIVVQHVQKSGLFVEKSARSKQRS